MEKTEFYTIENYLSDKTDLSEYGTKGQNRWIIRLPKIFDLSPNIIYQTSRPKIQIDQKHTPIWIKFKDPIGPSTTQSLWNLYLGLSDNTILNDNIVKETIFQEYQEKFKTVRDNGFVYYLEMLDVVNIVIEKWKITVDKIVEFDFGDLDKNINEPVECGMKIQPKSIGLCY